MGEEGWEGKGEGWWRRWRWALDGVSGRVRERPLRAWTAAPSTAQGMSTTWGLHPNTEATTHNSPRHRSQ